MWYSSTVTICCIEATRVSALPPVSSFFFSDDYHRGGFFFLFFQKNFKNNSRTVLVKSLNGQKSESLHRCKSALLRQKRLLKKFEKKWALVMSQVKFQTPVAGQRWRTHPSKHTSFWKILPLFWDTRSISFSAAIMFYHHRLLGLSFSFLFFLEESLGK